MKFVLLCSASVCGVDAHGYMANPVSRGVLQSTTPHGIGAVGPGGYINTCGQTASGFANSIQPPWKVTAKHNVNVYEPTRDCISTLKLGSIFRVHVRVKAHHIGFQELRLCESRLSKNTQDTKDCHLLERADASEVDVECSDPHDDFGPDDVCLPKDSADPFKWYMSPCKDKGGVGKGAMDTWCDKFMYFKMPAGITETQQATLQWYWKTGNSCTPGPDAKGTCNYVKDRGSDWCADQWPCVNCKTHPGSDSKYYDFSKGGERKACSEVFTTCADVILSSNKGDTTGPAGSKDAYEGNSDLSARSCDSKLLNVVYSDSANAYSVSGPSGASGGGSATGGGASLGPDSCPDGEKCYVTAWGVPCDPWAADAAACKAKGGGTGVWLPDAVSDPEPEPETEATTAAATTAAATTAAATTAAVAPSGCAALPGNRGATDAKCAKCLTGYKWWPCKQTDGLCNTACFSLLQQHGSPATKFAGTISAKVPITKHADIDAAGLLKID